MFVEMLVSVGVFVGVRVRVCVRAHIMCVGQVRIFMFVDDYAAFCSYIKPWMSLQFYALVCGLG